MKSYTPYLLFFLLIISTIIEASDSNAIHVILNKGNMPSCIYESNESQGIAFHWNVNSKKIPREIYYSKQSCKKTTLLAKAYEINFKDNLPPQYIEHLELSKNLKARLMAIRSGVNKYIEPSSFKDAKFLNGIFGEFNKDTNSKLIKDYHLKTSSTLFHNWISLKEMPKDCRPLIGTCEYYLCRESQKACNIDGYFLGFGYQYCSESLVNLTSKVSPKAQGWLREVAACLQNKMEVISNDNSCSDMKDMAIKSHDECYTETDFCSLDLKDAYKIIKMLRFEFDDMRIIKEGIEVLSNCRLK